MHARVERWELRDRPALRLVAPGLERIYRPGRRGLLDRAVEGRRRGPGRRALHIWRKHVKDLRYALEAIEVEGRPGRRVAKLARRADALGELLGEEHDLMVLAERAGSYEPLRRHRRARKQLLGAIARRRARLRKRALREGERLYERKPKRFAARVRAAMRA